MFLAMALNRLDISGKGKDLNCRLLYNEHAVYHRVCENVIEKLGPDIKT